MEEGGGLDREQGTLGYFRHTAIVEGNLFSKNVYNGLGKKVIFGTDMGAKRKDD